MPTAAAGSVHRRVGLTGQAPLIMNWQRLSKQPEPPHPEEMEAIWEGEADIRAGNVVSFQESIGRPPREA